MKSRIICTIAVFLSLTGLGASATLMVAADGSGDYTTIQAALNAAASDDEIVVADGVYKGPGNRDLDFHGKALTVRSIGGAANCIIDCEGLGRGLVFENGEGPGSMVYGFTITNGYHAVWGGAIECDMTSPTIANCIITNCSSYGGGAIDCFAASPIIIYCTFIDNYSEHDGGAIECYSQSNATITECRFLNNMAGYKGGAIDCYESAPVIVNCEFMGNVAVSSGGGIECNTAAAATITNCLLVGNRAGTYGGAIDIINSQPAIAYCTVVDNFADEESGGFGGIYADATSALTTVTSCILWNNGDDLEGCPATYSCIEDGDLGDGNISEDPGFRSGTLGDYYLRQRDAGQQPVGGADNSLCVDGGSLDLQTPEFDPFLYTTRTDNALDIDTPDIGYHYSDIGPVEEFALTVAVVPDGEGHDNGTVRVVGGALPSYRKYSEVAVRATPEITSDGYKIRQWYGLQPEDIVDPPMGDDIDDEVIITVLQDRDVSVEFMPWPMYVLTLQVLDTGAGIHGTLTTTYGADVPGEPGKTWQYAGGTVLVTAQPDPGWQVRYWSGTDDDADAIGRDYGYITMLSDATVTVEFVRDDFVRLDAIVVGGHGSVVPMRKIFDRSVNPDPWPVVQIVTAIPDFGYRVRRWIGTDDDMLTTPTNTVTMNWSKTVTVEFEPVPDYVLYTTVFSADGLVHGTIDPPSGPPNGPYPDGTTVPLLVTPDPGWEVLRWIGTDDDTLTTRDNMVTINGGDGDVSVELRREGLAEGLITLDGDPNFVYPTIQAAIDAAQDPANPHNEVVVARGTYTGPGNFDLNVLGTMYNPADPNTFHPITVRSDLGPNETIIDCGLAGRGFIFNPPVNNDFHVEGFTIRNGMADQGGGMYFGVDTSGEDPIAATPIIGGEFDNEGQRYRHCIIENCMATNGGGAIWFEGLGADEDAIAQDDEDAEYAEIRNCIIRNNISVGNGGGIYITNSASPRIISTEITGNQAGGFGGGVHSDGDSLPAIINCLFTLNVSGDIGGAIYLRNCDAIIRLCTIMHNLGLDVDDDNGPKGGIAARDSDPEINHCIIGRSGSVFLPDIGFWGDGFTGGDDLFGCDATYSCIENGDGGTGNIAGDPLHAIGGLGNFYLSQLRGGQQQNSPCYNAGEDNILGDLENQYGLSHQITTCILNQLDVGAGDLGYHYPLYTGPPIQRTLTMQVIGNGYMSYTTFGFPGQTGNVYPGPAITIRVAPGTAVYFAAYADTGYRVLRWTGTIDDYSTGNTNSVTVYDDHTMTLAFEKTYVRTFNIPGDFGYTQVQRAINTARDGDTIVLHSGVYTGADIVIDGKDITLTSAYPNDPAYVAQTVFDFGAIGSTGMHIIGTGRNPCVLNGVTIVNAFTTGGKLPSPNRPGTSGSSGVSLFGLSLTVDGSHIIANCVIRDAILRGRDGADGTDGQTDNPRLDAGNGGWGSSVGGAGLYVGPSMFATGWFSMGPMSPIITNCTIMDCIAYAGDGGNGGNSPRASRAGDGGVPGRVFGGAVFCDTGTNATFIDCTITGNMAQGGIGGQGGDSTNDGLGAGWGGLSDEFDLYRNMGGISDAADITWFARIGDPRQWTANGGGVYVGGYAFDYAGGLMPGPGPLPLPGVETHARFVNCEIAYNITRGSISGRGGQQTGYWPPFKHYQMPSYGAGFYAAEDAYPVLTDCRVMNNQTEPNPDSANYPDDYHSADQYYGYGGGVCVQGASEKPFMTMSTCHIAENYAPVGGGLYVVDANSFIADSNMVDNRSWVGGGIHFLDSPGMNIVRCLIQGNNAVHQLPDGTAPDPAAFPVHGAGGGIYGFTSEALVADSIITENSSSFSGGGVYLGGNRESIYPVWAEPEIRNCLITDNTALQDGGGLSINWFAEVAINNCTIVDNIVTGTAGQGFGYGGGVHVAFNSHATIKDSIIWYNRGSLGAQLAVANATPYSPGLPQMDVLYSTVGPFLDPNAFEELVFGNAADGDSDGSGGEITPTQVNTDVIIDAQTINDAFAAGGQRAKIVVSLKSQDLKDLRNGTDWKSPASVASLHQAVGQRQNAVLSTLAPAEFTIGQRYQNLAAFSGEVTPEGLAKLAAHPLVAHIEPERYVHPMMAQALALANALAARDAYDGTGVSIAIVDTGIDYTHPMLGGQGLGLGGFPNDKVIGGHDTAMKDVDPMPDFEAHGTACAGIAAGLVGLNGDYIGGVAYGAKLYALKIMDTNGMMPASASLAAWDWCLSNMYADPENPILVVSNSWGIYGLPFDDAAVADAMFPAEADAADALTSAGITVLAAAGNDGFAGQGIAFPAALSDIISVGAVFDTTDQVTGYSDTGVLLDILAPGDPIATTDIVGAGGYAPGDYFQAFNGTSAACPFAAGCVASIQSAAMEKINRYLTPREVKNLLIATGVPVTDTKVLITRPRVNLGAALASLTSIPIYVGDGCELPGWDAQNELWDFDTVHNIFGEPNFVSQYYLAYDSPCVDAGSVPATEVGMDVYTTRLDGQPDADQVDMGYHYSEGVPLYPVEVTVVTDPANPTITGLVQLELPDGSVVQGTHVVAEVHEGQKVTLRAVPNDKAFVKGWYDRVGRLVSTDTEITIIADDDNVFTVQFKKGRTVMVAGGGDVLRQAALDAQNGDILIVSPGTYQGNIDVRGRKLKIVSTDPNDPDTIAATIINCGPDERGFIFDNEEDSQVVVSGFTITNGYVAGESGGAMYFGEGTSPIIKNVRITNCYAALANGGALYIAPRSSPTFIRVVIEDSVVAVGSGGGVFIDTEARPTFIECSISGCSAYDGAGGAVYCAEAGRPVFTDCVFSDNASGVAGGAVYFSLQCRSKIVNCQFTDNTLYPFDDPSLYHGDGGAVYYSMYNTVDVADCNFIGNTADFGGAVYVNEHSTGTIRHVRVRDNFAGSDGGGIVLNKTSGIHITDCAFVRNSGLRGGGLCTIEGAGNVVSGSSFRSNTADVAPGGGGGTDSVEGFGGGLYAFGENIRIVDSAFADNVTGNRGGGIYLVGASETLNPATSELTNCLIVRNAAGDVGGGVACDWFAEAILTNCTISDNRAKAQGAYGGGLYCSYDSKTTVIDSIIWGNFSEYGSQVAVRDPEGPDAPTTALDIVYTDIGPNYDPNYAGGFVLDPLEMAIREGFDQFSLAANDDLSTGLVNIGFPVNFFGLSRNQLYVNNNGNITFDYPLMAFTPFGLTSFTGIPIVAPYFADVDTRGVGSNIVTYGPGTVDGHRAFGVNWIQVGYFLMHGEKVNSFQLILIEREDRMAGDFDIEFNYGLIEWETGDASGGVNGLGGLSARIGFSNGSGVPGTFYELPGSGIPGSFLDSNLDTGLIYNLLNSSVLGRYMFFVRAGQPEGFAKFGQPVWLDEGTVVNGEIISGFDPNTWEWDPATFNFVSDPLFTGDDWLYGGHERALFVSGYMLSHIDAGQPADSNCIDVGSRTAVDAALADGYTTRTDLATDVGSVDVGYHYRLFERALYALRVDIDESVLNGPFGTVDFSPAPVGYDPQTGDPLFVAGTEVTVIAVSNTGYRVREWIDTDDAPAWQQPTATVFMDGDQIIGLLFEEDVVRNLQVPTAYTTIEEAVAAASPGDTVIVDPGVHYITSPQGIDFQGKMITLMSTDPDNEGVIAQTIIDCQGTRYVTKRAFHFHSGETRQAVVKGFTIRNGFYHGALGGNSIIFPGLPIDPQENPPVRLRALGGADAVGDGYGGAIFCENESSPTFEHCVITDCTVTGGYGGDGGLGADDYYNNNQDGQWGGHGGSGSGNGYGGAVACVRISNPLFRNCRFENNKAMGGCGGNGGNGGSGNAAGAGGYGGEAAGVGMGGAIYAARNSRPRIDNCQFTNNEARWGIVGNGGARGQGDDGNPAATPGIDGTYYNFLFYYPTIDPTGGVYGLDVVSGGAACYDLGCNTVFTDCTFTGNKAYEVYNSSLYGDDRWDGEVPVYTRGGAIYSERQNSIRLQRCEFTDNMGGAVYGERENTIDIEDCLFSNNQSLDQADYEAPSLYSAYYYSNYFFGYYYYGYYYRGDSRTAPGGALYVGPQGQAAIEGTSFLNNQAYMGGAVNAKGSVSFSDCVFTANEASAYGGAVDAFDNTDPNTIILDLAFENCSFAGNTATWGGSVHAHNYRASLTDCYLVNNTARSGAGLFLSNGEVVVTGGLFRGNEALDESDRGIDGIGAGMALVASTADISGATFTNNSTQGRRASGAAIAFYGGDTLITHEVANCLFTGNHADLKGGAISASNFSEPIIANCTFADNTAGAAGGAIGCDWMSSLQVTNSIFARCSNHAIAEEDLNGSQITYNLFHDNVDGANHVGSDYGLFNSVPDVGTGLFTYPFISTLTGPALHGSNRSGNPLFVQGPLGGYYLSQTAAGQAVTSPAVDAGNGLPDALGLTGRITRSDGVADQGTVDMGYHYPDHTTLPQYTLTLGVTSGHGTLTAKPATGPYYGGTVVELTAHPEQNYRVARWSGGTIDDLSRETNNLVIMSGNKNITVTFDQPRILVVGSQGKYTSIQRAIDDAVDGDIVMLQTGQYTADTWGVLDFYGKDITLAGTNPDDENVVSSTVLEGYVLSFAGVGPRTVLEGFTLTVGRVALYSSSPTIRNCRFVNCHWFGIDGDSPQQNDGVDGGPSFGAAIRMYDSSPQVLNCTFDDCSVTGGDGGDGDNGVQGHGWGWDGGWAGRAYGGAVYAAYNSNPVFRGCTFTNCFARGGNGGNGGDGIVDAGVQWPGGRGGNWIWADAIEQSTYWYWWIDGWYWGDKFGDYGWFWWYDWYDGTEDWYQDYLLNGPDPFDRYYDYWRYSGYGGTFYCEVNCKPKFYNCEFTANNTYGGDCGIGGGPFIDPGPTRPMDLETGGGAIYIGDGCKPLFVDCLIGNNTADTTTVQVPDDYYTSFGGGIMAEDDSDIMLVNCDIQYNRACEGGGLYWMNSNADVVDCNFVENVAYHGGGMYSGYSTGSVDKTFLTSNYASVIPTADPGTGGGGMTAFDHVVYGRGGGYYSLSTLVDITDSVFQQNLARSSGGGIFFVGSDQDNFAMPTLHNSLIVGNTAGRDGGGVSVNWFAEPEILDCTIADNLVTGALGEGFGYGGGLSVSYNSRAYVSDSIIWGNAGANGAQIAVGSGDPNGPRTSEITLVYSDVGPPYDPNAFDDVDLFADDGGGTPGGSGTTAKSKSNDLVLVDGQAIYGAFDGGADKVPVVVMLQDFPDMRKVTDWDNPTSTLLLRQAIADRQNMVLATLSPAEFTLTHAFENVSGFAGEVTPAGLGKLLSNPNVVHVEPSRNYQPMMAQALALTNALLARQAYNGTGISIAIVDTGIDYTHEALGAGGFPNLKVIGGWDTGMNDPDPMPVGEAHGTCCAGIAAGDLGTVGDYIGGVAYGARLYALKIADDAGLMSTAAIIAAWDWCVTNKNLDPLNPILVMSNSFGIYGLPFTNSGAADAFSPAMTAAANAATAAGITMLAASGNDGFAGDGISHPAAMSDIISVGAVFDTTDAVTPYSNTAELLDILAPGDPIYTTDIVGLAGYDVGDYFPFFNGTSAACPFAAGCVADIQAAALDKTDRYLTPGEVRALLIATGVPVTDTKVAITKPRVNLGAAIANLTSLPIFVDAGCVLHGWDPNSQQWDPATNNIMLDPLLVGDYFLSEIEAGQLEDSPCLNIGSDLSSAVGLDQYTTRGDSVPDNGVDASDPNSILNLGFHHLLFDPVAYRLNYYVIVDPFMLPDFEPVITKDPDRKVYPQLTQVRLGITEPVPFGYHCIWKGSDDDRSHEPTNVVTMDTDKIVTVSFESIGYILDAKVVVDANILPGFQADITLAPPGGVYYPGTVVNMIVTPPPPGFQVQWIGTDDGSVVDVNNVVTMDSDKEVIASYEPIKTDYYALIVGIADYIGLGSDLLYPAHDASQFYQKLLKSPNWKKENMVLLLNQQATKSNIRIAIDTLGDTMDHDDVFVFYFAGQGTSEPDVFPIDEIDGFDEHLVTYAMDTIRDDELGDWLSQLATTNYVILLDTSFAGGFIDSGGRGFAARGMGSVVPAPGDSFADNLVKPATTSGGLPQDVNDQMAGVTITACASDQFALEVPELRHGLFTYFLLKAIDGDADWVGNANNWVSAEEAYRYLGPKVVAYVEDAIDAGLLARGTKQGPRMYDADKTSEMEFVQVEPRTSDPSTWYVPGDADTIQEAIELAKDGDVIILGADTYRGGGIILDKAVTITSTNPDDPDVVAMTIIDSADYLRRGIYFTSNCGPDTVLNGITITHSNTALFVLNAAPGLDGGAIGGGGLFIGIDAAPTIKNCVIRDFTLVAGNAGAGVQLQNSGDGGDGGFAAGGGVFCAQGSKPAFINTVIDNCHVVGGNGGNGAAANAIESGGRGGWGGWARGGGVYVDVEAAPTFTNCVISNCTATGGNGGNGGDFITILGIDVPGGYGGNWSDDTYAPWQMWGYEGDYRYYSGYGAGVYCAAESSPVFTDCMIIANSTQGGLSGLGGLMPAGADRQEPLEVYEVPSYGGGVYCAADSAVQLIDCVVSQNAAPKPAAAYTLDYALGHGGGIAFESTASTKLADCLITENEAAVGGGVYWYDASPEIVDCNVLGNLAYYGGGVYGLRGGALITGGFIHKNFAGSLDTDVYDVVGEGGGLHLAMVSATLRDLEIMENQANASGGGLFLTGTKPLGSTLKNCLVHDNRAGRDGGGLSVNWFSRPVLSNCTIADNWATGYFGFVPTGTTDPNAIPTDGNDDNEPDFTGVGGGLYCAYNSAVSVVDSIFSGNFASGGRQITVGTGFEFDPRPSTLNIDYTDVHGGRGQPSILVEDGCTLVWGEHNLVANPVFASGPRGDYYLSQRIAGQSANSPCVNSGSKLASEVEMHHYTTRSDDAYYDVGQVDMGYHYQLGFTPLACRFCDIILDGSVDIVDLESLADTYWLSECSTDCEGADLNADFQVDMADFVILASCWLAEDLLPPDPVEWDLLPQSAGTSSVEMSAQPAVDAWFGDMVQYRFKCETDDALSSAWQQNYASGLAGTQYISDPAAVLYYKPTGLTPGEDYTFVLQVRDHRGNMAESVSGSARAGVETIPPQPNPSVWATLAIDGIDGLPRVATATSVRMTARVATDDNGPVEYYFRATDVNGDGPAPAGGDNSGWQLSPTYEDTGLTANVTYSYRVRTRDRFGNPTDESPVASVLMDPQLADDLPPQPNPPTWAWTPVEDFDGEVYWHYMSVNPVTDPSGVEYRFECIDNDFDSGWINALTPRVEGVDYPMVRPTPMAPPLPNECWVKVGGLPNQKQRYRVQTRDQSPRHNTSNWSTTQAANEF